MVPLEIFAKDPYKCLVSTVLSSRTKDEVTLAASKRLFKVAPTITKLEQLKESDIKAKIYPVGFYNTKAKYLKRLARIIVSDFGANIPNNRLDLMKLPGVGRKTANLVINRAYGIPAISVDTHVHKISNLLGWVNTKTPQKTEAALVKILPKKYWRDVNRLFVSIGRQYPTKKSLVKFLKKEKLITSSLISKNDDIAT